MIDFLFTHDNLPYVIALGILAILGLIEVLSLLIGISFLNLLDDWAPNDSASEVSGVTGLTGWLCINRLPLLIWFVLALVSFAVAGLCVNYISLMWFDSLFSQSVSLPISLMLMALSCHLLGDKLAALLPKNESSAVSIEDFNGCVGVVTIGKAVVGNPSEAVIKDGYSQKHYVLVEPDTHGDHFLAGTQIVLLKRKGSVWSAAKLE